MDNKKWPRNSEICQVQFSSTADDDEGEEEKGQGAGLAAAREVISNNSLHLVGISVKVDTLEPVDEALVSEMTVGPELENMVSLVDPRSGAEGLDVLCHQEPEVTAKQRPLISTVEGMRKLGEHLNWELQGRRKERGVRLLAEKAQELPLVQRNTHTE